ncbi:MAG: MaoC/PaaZ C-terminal domain-containing protein [Paraburkholderia sp.]|uniref:MaoC family dehydratase n=1 Tax=Paraburkholderia sp. TaxID=1926495 RepID=UPI00397ABDCD
MNSVTQTGNKSLTELVGFGVSFSRTVSESDIYGFAGITGDYHPNHTNEVYARKSGLGGRVAQGALLVGYMAGGSTRFLAQIEIPAVSYGYDNVRFIKPVSLGDTITVHYKIARGDDEKRRLWANVEIVNQNGALVAVGVNILYFRITDPSMTRTDAVA